MVRFFKRGAIASVSSTWACALPTNRLSFKNKPAARGSITDGRNIKGEILGAGVGFEPTTFDL